MNAQAVWPEDGLRAKIAELEATITRQTESALVANEALYAKGERVAALEAIVGKQEEELHQGELRIAELEAKLKASRTREWALERARKEDAIDHAGDVRHANALREQAEAELAEERRILEMLDDAGVHIVSAGGSFTLAEFRAGLALLQSHKPRAEEGRET